LENVLIVFRSEKESMLGWLQVQLHFNVRLLWLKMSNWGVLNSTRMRLVYPRQYWMRDLTTAICSATRSLGYFDLQLVVSRSSLVQHQRASVVASVSSTTSSYCTSAVKQSTGSRYGNGINDFWCIFG
jgi:hypothetical protein